MLGFGKKEFVVQKAVPEDYGALADLHALHFARGWSTSELEGLAGQSTVTILSARLVGKPKLAPVGFNIMRQTESEAEILSIAVDTAYRQVGLGQQLMRDAILRLKADRVAKLILEVDATNVAAVTMYQKLGFETVGNRPGYYSSDTKTPNADRATALVMRLELA